MAGRRPDRQHPAAGAQVPGVEDAGVQRALDVLAAAVAELQARSAPDIRYGNGSPEGVVAAPVGALYVRRDGAASTVLYVKETGGTGPTGWAAK